MSELWCGCTWQCWKLTDCVHCEPLVDILSLWQLHGLLHTARTHCGQRLQTVCCQLAPLARLVSLQRTESGIAAEEIHAATCTGGELMQEAVRHVECASCLRRWTQWRVAECSGCSESGQCVVSSERCVSGSGLRVSVCLLPTWQWTTSSSIRLPGSYCKIVLFASSASDLMSRRTPSPDLSLIASDFRRTSVVTNVWRQCSPARGSFVTLVNSRHQTSIRSPSKSKAELSSDATASRPVAACPDSGGVRLRIQMCTTRTPHTWSDQTSYMIE